MPVEVRAPSSKGGKFRVVEVGSGKLATKNGKPIDGGGFSSKNEAVAQVQAVNISLKKQGKI